MQESESYICHRCGGREFDSLRAVSLFNQQDGMFHCDICEDILTVRENKAMREEIEKIQNVFHTKFEPLKARLESMRKMYIPRHIVLKKTVYEKMLEDAKKGASGSDLTSGSSDGRFSGFKRDFTQFASVLTAVSGTGSGGARQPFTAAAPSWIRDAQVPSPPGISREMSIDTSTVFTVGSSIAKKEEPVVVITAKSEIDVKTIIESSNFGVAKKEERVESMKEEEDFQVSVAGTLYPLGDVRNNDSLIEQMTDEEYVKFDQLIQRLGFK